MSTLRVNAIQNTSGVEQYLAKAWVNFNGTGTVAIRAAGNVSSITDNGVGDYTVNFTNAMADANYSITFGATSDGAVTTFYVEGSNTVMTTTSVKIKTAIFNGTTWVASDKTAISVAIFR